MKQTLASLFVLVFGVACSSSSDGGGASGSGGNTSHGGSAGAAGAHANGGGGAGGTTTGSAGATATGGSGGSTAGGSNGGTNTGGSAGQTSGTAGTGGASGGSGGSGGSTGTAFKCPAGPFDKPTLGGTATRVPGAPPMDDFNKNNLGNVEGPVWIGDSLYFSEMTGSNMIPPARILKLAPGGAVSVAVMDSGSNGLAVDPQGNLLAAVHKDGSISQISLSSGMATPLVSTYMGKRFTSPNDLAIRSDGTIYFSDPSYQNQANPQGAERLYWVTPAPARTVTAVTGAPSTPNGVTLSPDEKTLYVSGSGLKKFSVNTDGSLTGAADFVQGEGGDGMVVDCAGNLYIAGSHANNNGVVVYGPGGGSALGTITVNGGGPTTNVAFGGTDHKTLYITLQGNDGTRGVYSIALNVPGYPY